MYKLVNIANNALQEAHKVHNNLGIKGEELVRKKQFGDIALRADIETEEAVLKVLKDSQVPIKVLSEEHGIVTIGKDPKYLGILDGIDGTMVYKKARGVGRYGTMFGIYKGIDPTYADYLYGGIMEHAANKLYFATKGNGSWLIHEGKTKTIHCLPNQSLDKSSSKLYVDTAFDKFFGTNIFDKVSQKLKGYNTSFTLASCIHYADLVNGKVEAVIECTRKNNLEITVAYGLVKEAGGIMITEESIELGNLKYNEFGQNKHKLVLSTCTPQMSEALHFLFHDR